MEYIDYLLVKAITILLIGGVVSFLYGLLTGKRMDEAFHEEDYSNKNKGQ